MDALIGKAGKRLFEKHLEQYAPPDPQYESYMNDRGQTKRRKRPPPPGLSKRDARILKSVQRRAHYLDKGFNLCGLRFGWTFIIGFIPVIGDVANLSLNYYLVIRRSKQADIPSWLINRMQMHNIVCTGVGFVPVFGDVAAAVYKPNSRNAALLEEFMRLRGEEFLKQNPPQNRNASENGEGGWTWFTRPSVSRKNVEQVKPGAGPTASETVSTSLDDATNDSSALDPTSSHKPRKNFILFGRSGSAERVSPDEERLSPL